MEEKRNNIRIVMASHKACDIPSDDMYIPVFIGSALRDEVPEGFTPDNTGENISILNPMYSELTGLYWGWKNIPEVQEEGSFIGLVHYRRFFGTKKKGPVKRSDLDRYLGKKKLFLPKHRHYYISTMKEHYCSTQGSLTFDECEKILSENYPQYEESFDRAMGQTHGCICNMMIMRKDLADEYLPWLFDILRELCLRVDSSGMSEFDRRFPGRISELLLNVWVDHQITTGRLKKSDIMYLPWYNTTGDNLMVKAKAFLRAKYKGEKYKSSF